MTTNQFINIVKTVVAPPVDYLLQSLVLATKNADPDVHAAFFDDSAADAPYLTHGRADVDPSLREFAVKYLSLVMATNSAYGFDAAIQNVNPDLIDNWFLRNGNTVGQNMFFDYMLQPERLGAYFQNPQATAAALAAEIGNEAFLNGLLVECDTIGSLFPARNSLLLLRELDQDGPHFKQVLQAWVTNKRWSDLEGYDTFSWLAPIAPSFKQDGPAYQQIHQIVSAACTASEQYAYTEPYMVGNAHIGVHYEYNHFLRTTYGSKVAAWLGNTNGPTKYGLRSGAALSNIVVVQTDQSGCVVAGTPIRMADGSVKAVEHIQEGDRVLAGGGAVSVCSSELVVNQHLTHLYSLNDDAPCMSLEHAVMTQRGWCSVAPMVSMEFTPHHAVRQLAVGDVVWKLRDTADGEVAYDKVVVERINIAQYAPGEAPVGFDLHFRSGQPSYHANGYCCLVSYPEITAQRITSNVLSDMTQAERVHFAEQLEGISPLLGKALGVPLLDVVKSALEQPLAVASRARHANAQGRKRHHLRGAANLVLPALQVRHDAAAPAPSAAMSTLALMHGSLFIDGAPVATHCEDNHVFWHRSMPDGASEYGAVRMAAHGLYGQGVVQQDGRVTPFSTDGMFHYHATLASQPNGFDFELGFVLDANSAQHATANLIDTADASRDADLKRYARIVMSQVVGKQSLTVLHAQITFDPNYCSLGASPWISAELDFTMNYSAFSGSVYAYDAAQPGYRGAAEPVTGTITEQPALAAMQRLLTQVQRNAQADLRFLDTAAPAGSVPAAVAPALALATAIAPNVSLLFDSTPPDAGNLHALSFGKLKSLMLHGLYAQGAEYAKWFGEADPVVGPGAALTPQEAKLGDEADIKDFLVNRFAIGYLTQALSTSTEDNIKQKFAAIPDAGVKLSYFWKGDGTTSFAKDKGYNEATAALMDSSFVEIASANPELAPFFSDDPVGSARALYDYCVVPVTLNGLAFQNELAGQTRLTYLCNMLHALDPIARIEQTNGKAVSYATSLYQRVLEVRLNEVIRTATVADQKDLVAFLTAYYQQYFDSLVQGDKWDASIRAEALKELQALMTQFGVDSTTAVVEQMQSFIADSVAILVTGVPDALRTVTPAQAGKPVASRIRDWANSTELAERNPRLVPFLAKGANLLRVGLSLGLYGFGMAQSIKALMDWDKLSPQAKAQAIVAIVDIAVSMFNDFATIMAARAMAAPGATVAETLTGNSVALQRMDSSLKTPLLDGVIHDAGELTDVESPALSVWGRVGAADAAQGLEALAAAESRWTAIARVAGAFAKGMAIIGMAAACVGAGFQIANDFATGQPVVVQVFDILSEVANGVALAAEIAGLAFQTLDFIPVVGVVAAVVGILISFILSFIHRTPPPTPQETFVDEHCKPFLDGLAMPPQAWIDAQNKLQQHVGAALARRSLLASLALR